MQKAIIVLPTYNEQKNISTLIKDIFEVDKKIDNWEFSIVVVDSNSPDKTADVVKKLQKNYSNLHLLETEKEGLGKAYIRGFAYSLSNLNPDLIFEMDSDLSHNPADIPKFIEKIQNGADFVIGSRYIKGGSIPKNWAFKRKLFSIVANIFVRVGFMKPRITEWTNGYRAIKPWLIKKNLQKLEGYTGYVFQVAFIDNALKAKAKISEVPVNFIDRVEGVSKIDSFEYIYQTIVYVIRNSSFIKFCIVGGFGFVIDFGLAYTLIHYIHFPKVISNMLSAEIAIISNFLLNNYWSFSHKRINKSVNLFLSLLKFNAVSSGSVIIQGVGMWVALSLFGDIIMNIGTIEFHSWIIYKIFIILIIVIPYSYFFYNRFVWR
jgi:dolichol-phosphate mannosyltransferase